MKIPSASKFLILGLVGQSLAASFTGDQYTKAMWMATRFYGAMRSGAGPNWILQDTKYPTSFVKDSYKGRDVSGGWFDCGDHVVFGQTQFYSTYVLTVGLDQFPTGAPDLYSGDYSDYKLSKDYSIAGGTPNGLKDLLEEIRYNVDFLVKITPDPSTFVVQIGDGDLDHIKWVTAGRMAAMSKSLGGEADGSRYTNPSSTGSAVNDAYSPGMAAAALAVMARRDPDPDRRATYLAHALNAYAYSRAHTGVSDAQSYYAGSWWSGRYQEARFLAALELWRTTGTDSFKTQATSEWSGVQHQNGSYTRLDYTNAVPLAWVMAMKYMPNLSWSTYLTSYLQNYRNSVAGSGVTTWKASNGSFALRSASGAAFIHALYEKFNNDTAYNTFIFKQIDYILGANSSNQSYMMGWDENSAKQPPVVHHRGYYGNEDSTIAIGYFNSGANKDKIPARNKFLGAVIPGATDGSVSSSITDYGNVEPCLEQNAPLVGALAYLVSLTKPVDSSMSTAAGVARSFRSVAGFSAFTEGRDLVVSSSSGLGEVSVLDPQGRSLARLASSGSIVRWTAPRSGLYLVRVRTSSGWVSSKVVVR